MFISQIPKEFLDAVCDEIEDFAIHIGRHPKYLLLGTATFDSIFTQHYNRFYDGDGGGEIISTILGLRVIQCYALTNYIGVS